MSDYTPDRNTHADFLVTRILEATRDDGEIDQGLLRELLDAGRNALLGETTVHTVVHGRREGEEAAYSGRIGRGRIGPVLPPGDGDDDPRDPAVQINIWVRR